MTDQHDELLITIADLKAMEDVLDRVIEMTESMSVEEAADYKFSLESLAKKAKLAADMCNMQGVKTLEGQTLVVGRNTYKTATATRWVTDHPRLRQRIVSSVCFNRDTGAKRRITVEDAVTEAVDMMTDLFVAPSDVPKAGGLKKLRLAKSDICEEVRGKSTLVQVTQ